MKDNRAHFLGGAVVTIFCGGIHEQAVAFHADDFDWCLFGAGGGGLAHSGAGEIRQSAGRLLIAALRSCRQTFDMLTLFNLFSCLNFASNSLPATLM